MPVMLKRQKMIEAIDVEEPQPSPSARRALALQQLVLAPAAPARARGDHPGPVDQVCCGDLEHDPIDVIQEASLADGERSVADGSLCDQEAGASADAGYCGIGAAVDSDPGLYARPRREPQTALGRRRLAGRGER
jgi:hypothetical protein